MLSLDRLPNNYKECLIRLLHHVDAKRIALAGGLAIDLHLQRQGIAGRSSGSGDFDFVASGLDTISPSVTADFLVSHYHLPQPKFLVQLVDPVSRIRVDVFPDLVESLADAEEVNFADRAVRMLTPEAIFAHKVLTLETALSNRRAVDPKHRRDALAVGELLGRTPPSMPDHLLLPDVYSTNVNMHCQKCEASTTKSFALAPKRDILNILGHV